MRLFTSLPAREPSLHSEAFHFQTQSFIGSIRDGREMCEASLYKGHAFSLNSFIKLTGRGGRTEVQSPFPSVGKFFKAVVQGGLHSPVFTSLICFFGVCFGCYGSFITHRLLLKKSHARARCEAEALFYSPLSLPPSLSLSQTQTSTHTLPLNSMGDVFLVLCMV